MRRARMVGERRGKPRLVTSGSKLRHSQMARRRWFGMRDISSERCVLRSSEHARGR